MSDVELTKNMDEHILSEQFKRLNSGFLISAVANLLVCSTLVFVLLDAVDIHILITWWVLLCLVIIGRSIFYFKFKDNIKRNVKLKLVLFSLGCGLTGLVWGVGVAVIFPVLTLNYQVFVIAALMGMGAGSMSTLSVYKPAFFSFFPILFLPATCLLFFRMHEPIYISIGVCSLLIIISMSYFSVQNNSMLIQSLKLRFENQDLIEELQAQTIRADQANLAKSKFLAAASHDLRQPLYALILFSSELSESDQDESSKKLIGQIQRVANSLQHQFDALLDISQLESGGVKADIREVDLASSFDDLENVFSPQAKNKGLIITWPECKISLKTDEILLNQILSNLISNAIRYTQFGKICIDFQIKDSHMLISVEDTGIGIAQDEQSRIFSECYQENYVRGDKNQGLGLGLFIAQRTAKLLGYVLSVESQPNKGAVFSLSIPISSEVN